MIRHGLSLTDANPLKRAEALDFVIDIMGKDHICMGSDYPFPLGEHHPGKLIESMDYASELKDKLLYKNAMDWLGK